MLELVAQSVGLAQQSQLTDSAWEELLLGMQCAARDPKSGAVRPTNLGLLMFGRDPQWFIPQSEVVCIKYADPLGVRHYIDRKNYHGTLPELIDQASGFLRQYIRVGATIRGFYREDEPEYPYEAIRREKGSISTGEYSAATGASERTALRELREMVDRGIIVSRGKTRGLCYFLP